MILIQNMSRLRLREVTTHNWVIDHHDSQNLAECVEVYGDKTGIAMKISSDYPGIQMYTGNYIGNVKGKHGHIYAPRDGVCFEPQYFPDAVNRPEFEVLYVRRVRNL